MSLCTDTANSQQHKSPTFATGLYELRVLAEGQIASMQANQGMSDQLRMAMPLLQDRRWFQMLMHTPDE